MDNNRNIDIHVFRNFWRLNMVLNFHSIFESQKQKGEKYTSNKHISPVYIKKKFLWNLRISVTRTRNPIEMFGHLN